MSDLKEVPEQILIVDDAKAVRRVFERALTGSGYRTDTAADAETGLELVKAGRHDLVLCDINMPDKDGTWLLSKIQKLPDPPMVIMVTGRGDIKTAIHCLTGGAHDYLLKPIEFTHLRKKVKDALSFRRLLKKEKRHKETVEELVIVERQKGRQLFLSAIDALTRALEAKDQYTEGHSSRVALLVEGIVTQSNLRSGEINNIVTAARCHDIGKIGVEDTVLLKKGKLSREEFDRIKTHPEAGARIITPIFKETSSVVDAVRYHHERLNGSGYPSGLKGNRIPFAARIIAIADSYDAMTSNRVYRRAMSSRKAVDEIIACTGKLFCPEAVKSFLKYYRQTLVSVLKDEDSWQDKRRYERFDFEVDARLDIENQHLPIHLINISRFGLCFQSSHMIEADREIRIRFSNQTEVRGVLCWRRPPMESNEDDDSSRYGTFIESPDEGYLSIIERISSYFAERRNLGRINQIIPVMVINSGETSNQNIVNLSKSGAFVQARSPMPVGEELDLIFSLPNFSDAAVEVKALVIHSLMLKEALLIDGALPGMGVKFIDIAGEIGQRIESFIDNQNFHRHKYAIPALLDDVMTTS